MRLTLSSELRQQIDEIVAPLLAPAKWAAMELPFAKFPHAIVRFEGPPGCGKTVLAQHMAEKFDKPPIHVSFEKMVGTEIGTTERKIDDTFRMADETQTSVVIMEECDSLFFSRDNVTPDTPHILSFVNTLLICIDRFIQREIPSMLLLTTNYPQHLDAALESRLTDVVYLHPPTGLMAEKMWLSKLPYSIKSTIKPAQLKLLSSVGATPRQMEKAILKICRAAMVKGTIPKFADFQIEA